MSLTSSIFSRKRIYIYVAAIPILLYLLGYFFSQLNLNQLSNKTNPSIWPNSQSTPVMTHPARSNQTTKAPVYFLGIGGPNFIGDINHPAYDVLTTIGKDITTKIKPTAIVVFSAHWQTKPDEISINVHEDTDLIYDFSGFPAHYYKYDFPYKGSPQVAEKVIQKLSDAGIKYQRVKRGLDHGVWAGFLAAFDPKQNPLNVPIVQVSLYDNEDADQHYRLGQALQSLRDENILIIGAGMAVHNTAGFRATRGTGRSMPYTTSFEEILTQAATSPPSERQENLAALLKRADIRDAHPTFEHILPIFIAAGAAGDDVGERLWALPEGGLNWAQYRFGSLPVQGGSD